MGEFGGHIRANATWIPNYGERYRPGEAISNAFVESTVNQVVSKCMVKKQQMRWTPRGAHLLLQVRMRVLNNDLIGVFQRWYPAFSNTSDGQELARRLPHSVPLSLCAEARRLNQRRLADTRRALDHEHPTAALEQRLKRRQLALRDERGRELP